MKLHTKAAGWMSVCMAMVVGLAGCGGLGEGSGPVSAAIQPLGGVLGAPSTKAFVCLNTAISLRIDFSDGSAGDFTTRARFSSSNPAVARVSNFDIPLPEQAGSFYPFGSIIAVAPGTATITADYLSFSRSIVVTVSDINNLRVVPATADLAAKSNFDLGVTADLDGVTTAIDGANVSWSFTAPNTAVATINSALGTVAGVAAGAPLTARARLASCGRSADAQVTVANLQSLALTREFGAQDQLVVGNTERLIATGTLDNGMTQDLTGQVSYATSDATAISLLTSGITNLTRALKASTPVQLTASFASPAVTSPAINITPVADSLNSIAVTPASASVVAGFSSQFSATGSYASGLTQDVTRHVSWTSSDGSIAVIQSSTATAVNGAAGRVDTSSAGVGKSATLTATTTNAAAQSISASGTLTLQ